MRCKPTYKSSNNWDAQLVPIGHLHPEWLNIQEKLDENEKNKRNQVYFGTGGLPNTQSTNQSADSLLFQFLWGNVSKIKFKQSLTLALRVGGLQSNPPSAYTTHCHKSRQGGRTEPGRRTIFTFHRVAPPLRPPFTPQLSSSTLELAAIMNHKNICILLGFSLPCEFIRNSFFRSTKHYFAPQEKWFQKISPGKTPRRRDIPKRATTSRRRQ